ncbi:NAD-dependent succinate-semialdehyde dehydrogenase [Vreelandella jeotgali]|uniref:NAD-dependent succinate-semialdehyde dehydrogenase n=1 Tax=Vreelandella jeotgali TaxID=553386 RepID=UPI00034C6AC1|nr:NAD-dependent succinate-semialdehyde dehydrogenase [Halomonas jeotgali]
MADYSVINPATGEKLADYPTATDADIQQALTSAASAYRQWSRDVDVAGRAACLKQVAELHAERREALAEIIVREMGKPVDQAREEVDVCVDIYRYYADNAAAFLRDEPIDSPAGGSAFIRRQPLGVLTGIMPWNFPLYQVARFVAPNLALGNTILLKHAPQCPESALALERLFIDAGLPEGAYVNIFATNAQVADVIADPRVQGVSLTGSERAGAAVAEQAGRHLKKVVLELGGSDVFLVLDTDDIDTAVEMAVAGRLGNNGQACNGSKRMVVMDHLYAEFVERFAAAMTAQRPADPTVDGAMLGPLSSASATRNLQQQVQKALDQGAVLRAGGADPEDNYFAPTVLTDVTPAMDVYHEELFGPVAVVYRVASEDEAVELANASPYGLGAIVISSDEPKALRVADRLEVGMVYINEVGGESAELPFGGVKRSGFGRELGSLGMDEFVNKKLIRVT